MVPAPGSPKPTAARARYSLANSPTGTQRNTKFCSEVVLTVSSPKAGAIPPKTRIWPAVRSPSGTVATAEEYPGCFCRRTLVRSQVKNCAEGGERSGSTTGRMPGPFTGPAAATAYSCTVGGLGLYQCGGPSTRGLSGSQGSPAPPAAPKPSHLSFNPAPPP